MTPTPMIAPTIPPPEAPPASVNVQLSDYLGTQKEVILNEWLVRVHGDAAILASEKLNNEALKIHLPEMFENLMKTLRFYGSDVVAEKSLKDAEKHGATRLQQGYELPEMLRELTHLRAILIYHLRQFEGLHPEFGATSALFISTTMHRFIDEMMMDATEEYLWSQMSVQDQIHQGRIKW